ncbi:MAG: hypothetical protein ABFR19_02545 [Pseudomonadota bacterium]
MSVQKPQRTPFRPLRMIVVILLILLGISFAAQWYGRNVTMPRYCNDPAGVIARVHEVLTNKNPAGEGDRKPYIIAARLTFLLPRDSDEQLEAYIARLQDHVDQQCR